MGRISVYHTRILWRKEGHNASTNLNGLVSGWFRWRILRCTCNHCGTATVPSRKETGGSMEETWSNHENTHFSKTMIISHIASKIEEGNIWTQSWEAFLGNLHQFWNLATSPNLSGIRQHRCLRVRAVARSSVPGFQNMINKVSHQITNGFAHLILVLIETQFGKFFETLFEYFWFHLKIKLLIVPWWNRSGWSPSAGRHGDLCGPLRQRVLAKNHCDPTKRPAVSNRMPCPDARIAWRSKWRISGRNSVQRCNSFGILFWFLLCMSFQEGLNRNPTEKTLSLMTGHGWLTRAVSSKPGQLCGGSLSGVPLQHYSHLSQLLCHNLLVYLKALRKKAHSSNKQFK